MDPAEHADKLSYFGIGLLGAGVAAQFGWPMAAMVTGTIVLVYGLILTLRVTGGFR